VLRVEVDAPSYDVPDEGAVCALEATAVAGADGVVVFAVNRAAEPVALEARLRDLAGARLIEHRVLDGDIGASNTAEAPDAVAPRVVSGADVSGDTLRAELPARSWNVLRLAA
jgi:alpha-N-arabinofuranosidase